MAETGEAAERSESAAWYIWYTKPRAEKKVLERLQARGIEVFLPLRRELRQWSDRKKWVEMPLFSGYIFTQLQKRQWDMVSFTEGILTYVRFEGQPAVLRSEDLAYIRSLVRSGEALEVEDMLIQAGEPIEVVQGPLSGMRGELVSYRGRHKLAVRLEQLGKVVLVQMPVNNVRSLNRA